MFIHRKFAYPFQPQRFLQLTMILFLALAIAASSSHAQGAPHSFIYFKSTPEGPIPVGTSLSFENPPGSGLWTGSFTALDGNGQLMGISCAYANQSIRSPKPGEWCLDGEMVRYSPPPATTLDIPCSICWRDNGSWYFELNLITVAEGPVYVEGLIQ